MEVKRFAWDHSWPLANLTQDAKPQPLAVPDLAHYAVWSRRCYHTEPGACLSLGHVSEVLPVHWVVSRPSH